MTNEPPRHEDADRSVTIYDACRQFESAHSSGSDPRIEDFLRNTGEAERGILLRELLCMEVAVRRKRNEQPSLDEYHSRFPNDRPAVEEAFKRADTETLEQDVAATVMIDPPQVAEPAPSLGDVFTASGKTRILDGGGPRGPAPIETGGVSDYDLLEKLGEGGMGVVYRARQRSADRIVAVKVIRPDRLQNLPEKARQAAIDRFRNEAHATARINHDHIVTVYEVGQYEGRHYFSMTYVPGRSLSELTADGALSDRQVARYMRQVASAIQAAHLHGILHRDLKPQNVLVDEQAERAMVADFGLAKLIEDESQLTREGEVMGTPQYMSPEQTRDAASVTTLTDVYALGATLYHLLSGQPPFHGGTAVDVLRRVIDEQPISPSTIKDDVDPDLETICLKCMEKDPHRRYESARAVADELGRFLEGRPIQARPLGAPQRVWRWCRRNRLLASLAATAALSVMVALVSAIVGYVETTAALRTANVALDAEKIARKDAEANYRQALDAVNHFYTDVSEDELLGQPGMQPLRERLLLKARGYYEKLLTRPSSDDDARQELAANYFRVGRIDQLLKSREEALGAFQQARTMQEELLSQSPDDVLRLAALGNTLNAMGEVLHRQSQTREAERSFREAIRLRHRVVDATGERGSRRLLASAEMNLGILLHRIKRLDAAREQMISAKERREALLSNDAGDLKVRYDLGLGYYNLGRLELDAGEKSKTVTYAKQAVNVFGLLLPAKAPSSASPTSVIGAELSELRVRYSLVLAAMFLGETLTSPESRINAYQLALSNVKQLRQENPAVESYQVKLAEIALILGTQYAYKNTVGPDDIVAVGEHFRVGLNELKLLRERKPNRVAELLAGAAQVLEYLENKAPNDPTIVELKQFIVRQRQALENPGK